MRACRHWGSLAAPLARLRATPLVDPLPLVAAVPSSLRLIEAPSALRLSPDGCQSCSTCLRSSLTAHCASWLRLHCVSAGRGYVHLPLVADAPPWLR